MVIVICSFSVCCQYDHIITLMLVGRNFFLSYLQTYRQTKLFIDPFVHNITVTVINTLTN